MRMNKEILRVLRGARSASVIDPLLLASWGIPHANQVELCKYLKAYVTQQIDYAITEIVRDRDSKEKLAQ